MGRAVPLRDDYDGDRMRRLARESGDGDQVRRLLALAAICDGGRRADAAKVGGVTLQIVRDCWRRCDLARELYEEFGVSVEESTVGRVLREMGYRKISARPRHHAQNEYVVEDLEKPSPQSWRRSGNGSAQA